MLVGGKSRAERSNGDLSPCSRLDMPIVRASSTVTAAGIEAIASDPAPTKECRASLDA